MLLFSIFLHFSGNGNDWPIVPIFGRRKRPRQAFYASPTQDICKTDQPARRQVKNDQLAYQKHFNPIKMDEDVHLADLDVDVVIPRDTVGALDRRVNQNGDKLQMNSFRQRSEVAGRKAAQNIQLQKHPR